jgi:hypothetical protein
MNSLTYEKLPVLENIPTPNTHTQMTLENLGMALMTNCWYHSTIVYMRQLGFDMQGL